MPETAGAFPQSQPVDRSAFGLSIQHQQIDALARGSNLGIGQRVTPTADSLFSNPPMSGGQFGQGHAKSIATFNGQPMLGSQGGDY